MSLEDRLKYVFELVENAISAARHQEWHETNAVDKVARDDATEYAALQRARLNAYLRDLLSDVVTPDEKLTHRLEVAERIIRRSQNSWERYIETLDEERLAMGFCLKEDV